MRGTFFENNAIRVAGSPGSWAAAGVYGNFIDVTGFRRIVFLLLNGELDGDMAFKVYEATDSGGTDAQEVDSGLRNSFVNGTDENRIAGIEVLSEDLTTGYPFVGLLVTPTAADTFAAVAILAEPYGSELVSNETTDGVAFTDSLH